jgi:hypothetical protein
MELAYSIQINMQIREVPDLFRTGVEDAVNKFNCRFHYHQDMKLLEMYFDYSLVGNMLSARYDLHDKFMNFESDARNILEELCVLDKSLINTYRTDRYKGNQNMWVLDQIYEYWFNINRTNAEKHLQLYTYKIFNEEIELLIKALTDIGFGYSSRSYHYYDNGYWESATLPYPHDPIPHMDSKYPQGPWDWLSMSLYFIDAV